MLESARSSRDKILVCPDSQVRRGESSNLLIMEKKKKRKKTETKNLFSSKLKGLQENKAAHCYFQSKVLVWEVPLIWTGEVFSLWIVLSSSCDCLEIIRLVF